MTIDVGAKRRGAAERARSEADTRAQAAADEAERARSEADVHTRAQASVQDAPAGGGR